MGILLIVAFLSVIILIGMTVSKSFSKKMIKLFSKDTLEQIKKTSKLNISQTKDIYEDKDYEFQGLSNNEAYGEEYDGDYGDEYDTSLDWGETEEEDPNYQYYDFSDVKQYEKAPKKPYERQKPRYGNYNQVVLDKNVDIAETEVVAPDRKLIDKYDKRVKTSDFLKVIEGDVPEEDDEDLLFGKPASIHSTDSWRQK